MIVCDHTQLPVIYITFVESDWKHADYKKFINTMEQLLVEAACQNTPVKFLIQGNPDCKIKQSIPYTFYAWIICDIIRMKPLFINGLEKTALYTPTDNMDFFLDMLFKVYTPSRPLKRFYDQSAALAWLRL